MMLPIISGFYLLAGGLDDPLSADCRIAPTATQINAAKSNPPDIERIHYYFGFGRVVPY